jgi:4-amino-4-deoxy-L-arabinose transferase-like glycosyltransferase/Flp pilus assembly protein TadD
VNDLTNKGQNSPKDYPNWALGLVLLLALGLRLVHMFQMSSSPLFSEPTVDAGTYTAHAVRLAAGNWLGRGEGPFWQPPLYAYFLGAIRLVFSESFFYVARGIQACLGAFSCFLVYLIGRRLFSSGVGFFAAAATAVYGPLIYFDARLLPVSLATFLVLLGLWLLIRAQQRPTVALWLVAGFALGLAAITVATALVLVPTVVAWIFFHWRKETAAWRPWLWAGALLLGAMLAVAPVSWRNYDVGGGAVLISYNGGVNFYIGNNAEYRQTLAARPGWEWEKLVGRPLREGVVRPSQRSDFFYDLALDYMRESPWDYLGLQLRKAAQFWSGDEIERNQEIYYWRRYSTVLELSLWKWGVAFPFGLVSPLALVGIALVWRRRQTVLPVLFVLAFALGVSIFFVVARYRLPIVPLLLLFAVYGVDWLYRHWHLGGWRVGVPTAGLAVLLVAANWELPPMDMRGKASTHNDLGNTYLRQGLYDKALLKYEQATRRDSTYWQARFNLASMRAMRGDLAGAFPLFFSVSRHHPERADVWSNLAGTYVGLGDKAKAIRALEQSLRRASPHAGVYAELVRLYMEVGEYEKADAMYHQARWDFPEDEHLKSLHGTISH